jgi:hypothetical protein
MAYTCMFCRHAAGDERDVEVQRITNNASYRHEGYICEDCWRDLILPLLRAGKRAVEETPCFGPWMTRRLRVLHRFREPIPARGYQGLWNWPDGDVLARELGITEVSR